MGIKKRLASLMEEKNTNANDLAAKIGVAPTTIYSIMQRDSSRIDIDLIVKISHALGVTADELLTDELHQSAASPVGENIKKYRIAKGLTQLALSEKLDVSEKTVSSWEVSRTEPSIKCIEQIASVLGCRKSDLIGEPASITPDEYEMIKKFRYLDEYGCKNVLSVLDNEFERCVAQDRKKESNIS